MVGKKIVFALALLLIVLPLISSLTATIGNPRMVLYENITDGETLDIENNVKIINNNDFDIRIELNATGDWENRVIFEKSNFTIIAGETKIANYTLGIEEAGRYHGDIMVIFNDPNSNNDLALAQEVVLFAIDEETGIVPERDITGNAVTDSGNGSLIVGVVVLILLLAILISVLNYKKSGKKRNMRK